LTGTLSTEQVVQCDTVSYGCNGGWPENAYTYVKYHNGIESEADYPYTSSKGVTGVCQSDSSKFQVTVADYYTISYESNMGNHVLQVGPIAVCLDATNWNTYTGGVLTTCGKEINHCVQAVGIDTKTDGGFWNVRNSWGYNWGESGFIRLAWNMDTCAITNDATYVAVKQV
jgi:C1A family cysteine protease